MEASILSSIYHLYRSHVVTLILLILLGCVTLLVAVGVVKFNLIKPTIWKIVFVITTVLSIAALWLIQIHSLIPVYKDYKESSYVVIKDASLTILTGASGSIDRTNTVLVDDGSGKTFKLEMQTDYHLSVGSTYTGTIAYTIHSGYVVWYSFD